MKHVNGYEILGKTGHCNVYIRPSYDTNVRSMVYHTKPVNTINQIILTSILELTTFHQIKMQKILPNQLLTWSCLQNHQLVMSWFPTLLPEKATIDIKFKKWITIWRKCAQIKIIYVVDHSKNIKHQHLNKSK